MHLSEWKKQVGEELREEAKDLLREGLAVSATLCEEVLAELLQEIEVEDFCEDVDFEDEIELDNELSESLDTPQDFLEFVSEANGELMDVEVEIDTSIFNITRTSLEKIREAFFAESYTVTIDEASNRAKVVFKRAGGKIKKRKVCGKGKTLKGNKCVPMTGTKKAALRRVGIKIKRAKRAMGGGAKKRASLKAKITRRRVKGRARNYAGIK